MEYLNLRIYVFALPDYGSFTDNVAEQVHLRLAQKIRPSYIVTCKQRDAYWANKEKRARMVGGKLLALPIKSEKSTTWILQKLLETS